MRILGLDIGHKRIGVAVSDPLGITAQGLTVISSKTSTEAIQNIAGICMEYTVTRIVVGLPLNMDGTKGAAVKDVEQISAAIEKKTGLPVTFIDERLTSRAAERTLIAGNVRRKARKGVKDMLAAVLILETYLSNPVKRD
ncbi:MAG: Holliday junction resolvase RuvX [Bacillota bacterium]